jgi:hypothetical protein
MQSRLVGFGLCAVLALSACKGVAIGGIDGDPDSGPGPQGDASIDAHEDDAEADARAEVPDAHELPGDAQPAVCCPIDPTQSGCMHLGGASTDNGGSCVQTCDFFCSTNWRVEKDSSGCDTWRWDTRQPLPGENASCFPLAPGDAGDASIDGE